MDDFVLTKVLSIIDLCLENEIDLKNYLDEDLQKFGLNSIKFISIIVSLEEELHIQIPDANLFMPNLNTVNKILNLLSQVMN